MVYNNSHYHNGYLLNDGWHTSCQKIPYQSKLNHYRKAKEIYQALGSFAIADMLQRAEEEGAALIIWASIADSATRKDKDTHALEAVDWIFDHSALVEMEKAGSRQSLVVREMHLSIIGRKQLAISTMRRRPAIQLPYNICVVCENFQDTDQHGWTQIGQ